MLRVAMWGKLRVTVREGRAELLAREEEVMGHLDHPSLLLLLLLVEHLLLAPSTPACTGGRRRRAPACSR